MRTKRCPGGSCVYGTRAACLNCGQYGTRPGPVHVPSWERERLVRRHPGAWHNAESERADGVEDIAGWDDDEYPNLWG